MKVWVAFLNAASITRLNEYAITDGNLLFIFIITAAVHLSNASLALRLIIHNVIDVNFY